MIITLPITQRKTRPIPYFLTPLVGDILRKRTGNDLTVSVNALGARESNPEMSDGFSHDLRKIGIVYNLWSDLENFKSLFDSAKFTINKTRCIDKKENCYTCGCGLLEIPKSNVKFLKQKTFYLSGNEVFCRGCNNVSKLNTIDRLVMFFSNDSIESVQSNANLNIYPDFYSSEFKDLLWQIAYAEIFVTKTLWPDFRREELIRILHDYQKRERRFGLTGAQIKKGSSPDK